MNRYLVAALVSAVVFAAGSASAQEVRGFLVGGITRNADGDIHPAVGGGATVDLGTRWVSAGAQGETFFSGPYFAGRGAVFGQGNVPVTPSFHALVLGGGGFGEETGPLIGGGVEFRPLGQHLGLRITIEDYLASLTRYLCPAGAGCSFRPDQRAHQIAIRGGITF